jgi:hypothetical protein
LNEQKRQHKQLVKLMYESITEAMLQNLSIHNSLVDGNNTFLSIDCKFGMCWDDRIEPAGFSWKTTDGYWQFNTIMDHLFNDEAHWRSLAIHEYLMGQNERENQNYNTELLSHPHTGTSGLWVFLEDGEFARSYEAAADTDGAPLSSSWMKTK